MFCDGRPVPGWPQPTDRICCPVAVADVFEMGSWNRFARPSLAGDGQLVQGWPQGDGNCFCAPSLADLEGDGRLEILEIRHQTGRCIRRGDGTMLPGWPVSVPDNDVRSTPLSSISSRRQEGNHLSAPRGRSANLYADGKPFRD